MPLKNINDTTLQALTGESITIYARRFMYRGDLAGVGTIGDPSNTYIKLISPEVIFIDTGMPSSPPNWVEDGEALSSPLYILVSSIESFELSEP